MCKTIDRPKKARRPQPTLAEAEHVRRLHRVVELAEQVSALCEELIDDLPGSAFDRNCDGFHMSSILQDLSGLAYNAGVGANLISGCLPACPRAAAG